jgi:hypothetical protein
MPTFEVDDDLTNPDERPRTVMSNPLSLSDDELDTGSTAKGNVSPVSPKDKSALSNNASLIASEARNLDMAERKWLQDKWFALDTSGDGLLELRETKELLRDIKKNMTDAEMLDAFKEIDSDGCGRVDFDEFYLWFAHQDADQFAHLMSRGAHRDFLRGMIILGVTMFLPCVLILLISGPSIVVSFLRIRPPAPAGEQACNLRSHGLCCGRMCLRTTPWISCSA